MLRYKKSLTCIIIILGVLLIGIFSEFVIRGVFGANIDFATIEDSLLRRGVVAVCCTIFISVFALKRFKNSAPISLSSGKRKGFISAIVICGVLCGSFLLFEVCDSLFRQTISESFYRHLEEGTQGTSFIHPINLLCMGLANAASQLIYLLTKFVDFLNEHTSDIFWFIDNRLSGYIFSGLLFFSIYGVLKLKKSFKHAKL